MRPCIVQRVAPAKVVMWSPSQDVGQQRVCASHSSRYVPEAGSASAGPTLSPGLLEVDVLGFTARVAIAACASGTHTTGCTCHAPITGDPASDVRPLISAACTVSHHLRSATLCSCQRIACSGSPIFFKQISRASCSCKEEMQTCNGNSWCPSGAHCVFFLQSAAPR